MKSMQRASSSLIVAALLLAAYPLFAIRISGDRSIPVARTGAGVRLGDGIDQLVAKYGYRYQTAHRRHGNTEYHAVLFDFSDETELEAGFNDDGVIDSFELTVTEE